MNASLVVIEGETIQLAIEVEAVPEKGLVEIFAPEVPMRWVSRPVASAGLLTQPVKATCRSMPTIRISDDEITVDITGSAPQQVGPVNSPLPSTALAVCDEDDARAQLR
jgi:hypothetical protein